MPQTVIFLEDLGLGEKGIAEMLAPILTRLGSDAPEWSYHNQGQSSLFIDI
jgi:hypothetical protein